jgi:hypothetical protein
LTEQHSGISFKCNLSEKIFRRNDKSHICRARKDDLFSIYLSRILVEMLKLKVDVK